MLAHDFSSLLMHSHSLSNCDLSAIKYFPASFWLCLSTFVIINVAFSFPEFSIGLVFSAFCFAFSMHFWFTVVFISLIGDLPLWFDVIWREIYQFPSPHTFSVYSQTCVRPMVNRVFKKAQDLVILLSFMIFRTSQVFGKWQTSYYKTWLHTYSG